MATKKVARKYAPLSDVSVDIVCGSLTAKLFPNKLVNGYSRCISFPASGGSLMTPCEFEKRARQTAAKNWKKTICYAGKPIGSVLRCSLDPEGKKTVSF